MVVHRERYSWMYSMLLVFGVAGSIQAAPPWSNILSFKKVEADPKKKYTLTEDNGPWMVYAMSFSGEQAEQMAQRLVLEIRRDLKLPAYQFQHKFDFRERITHGFEMGANRELRTPKMRHLNEELQEYAVLVGNFASLDDPEMPKAIKAIKTAKPKCLTEVEDGKSYHHLAQFREELRNNVKSDKQRGPMASAFGTRNPLVAQEYFTPKGPDKLVTQMNRDVEYSLLKNKGKYTIQIARFTGLQIIDQKLIEERERTDTVSDKLVVAAENAHNLTLLLRKQGVEAYQYHDRTESIVTVGSFNSLGEQQFDGKFHLNPQVEAVIKKFGPQLMTGKNGMKTNSPRVIGGVPLDIQPKPIEVPKVSIATAYAK